MSEDTWTSPSSLFCLITDLNRINLSFHSGHLEGSSKANGSGGLNLAIVQYHTQNARRSAGILILPTDTPMASTHCSTTDLEDKSTGIVTLNHSVTQTEDNVDNVDNVALT